jgi:hypothetical protein
MASLDKLKQIAAKAGYTGQDLRRLEEESKRLLNSIEVKAKKNIVLSTHDVENDIGCFIEDEDIDPNDKVDTEDYTNNISKYLFDLDLIYKWADKESYLRLVRDLGKTSLQERIMSKNIANTTYSIQYRDTEFPINKNGIYILS